MTRRDITCRTLSQLFQEMAYLTEKGEREDREYGFQAYIDRRGRAKIIEHCKGTQCSMKQKAQAWPSISGNIAFHTHPCYVLGKDKMRALRSRFSPGKRCTYSESPSVDDWNNANYMNAEVECVGSGSQVNCFRMTDKVKSAAYSHPFDFEFESVRRRYYADTGQKDKLSRMTQGVKGDWTMQEADRMHKWLIGKAGGAMCSWDLGERR